ncbi:hypothetical protein MLD38_017600 [Melastoma candidum]|uniref:Uncharacterized protein n=1 Tax=Melastoma candidum TaxID=119954 RepID=A0ACB9QR74_9MYRT|nr:hypothetical protein MLD38_017600 [Melastoma candidum]
MEKPVFEMVAKEIEAQMREYRRSIETETKTGLQPCFNISGTKKGDAGDICFTVVTNDGTGSESVGISGPAIILGSFQQQNFYVEYDLENERLGSGNRTASNGRSCRAAEILD